jgi:hypothetical protein
LRENYAPDKIQGNDGITLLVDRPGSHQCAVEYVFGFRPDVPANTLLLDVNLTDEYGVKQYPFGKSGNLNIAFKKRKTVNEKPIITIETNQPIKLKVQWPGGKIEKQLVVGKNKI